MIFFFQLVFFFYTLQRGVNVPKVLVFSENGDFRQAWNSTVEMPHGIFVASNGTDSSVWITDVGNGMSDCCILKVLAWEENNTFVGIPLNICFELP